MHRSIDRIKKKKEIKDFLCPVLEVALKFRLICTNSHRRRSETRTESDAERGGMAVPMKVLHFQT